MFKQKVALAILACALSWMWSGCYGPLGISSPKPFEEMFSSHRLYGDQLEVTFRENRVESLIKNLGARNIHTRRQAVLSLGGIRPIPQEAIPALINALNDVDRIVRRHAVTVLRLMDTAEARKAVAEFEKNNC